MKKLGLSFTGFILFLTLCLAQAVAEDHLVNLFCGIPLDKNYEGAVEYIRKDVGNFEVVTEDKQSFGALFNSHPMMDFKGEHMVMTLFNPGKKVDKRFQYGIWIDANYGNDGKEALIENYTQLKENIEAYAFRMAENDIEYYDYTEGQTLEVYLSEKSKRPDVTIEWFVTLPGVHYLKIEHKHYVKLQ